MGNWARASFKDAAKVRTWPLSKKHEHGYKKHCPLPMHLRFQRTSLSGVVGFRSCFEISVKNGSTCIVATDFYHLSMKWIDRVNKKGHLMGAYLLYGGADKTASDTFTQDNLKHGDVRYKKRDIKRKIKKVWRKQKRKRDKDERMLALFYSGVANMSSPEKNADYAINSDASCTLVKITWLFCLYKPMLLKRHSWYNWALLCT